MQGGDTPAKIEAGMPNATGSVYASTGTQVTSSPFENATGVFYRANTTPMNYLLHSAASTYTSVGTTGISQLGLDLSKSNAIYGNSDTVQPPALCLIPQIKF